MGTRQPLLVTTSAADGSQQPPILAPPPGTRKHEIFLSYIPFISDFLMLRMHYMCLIVQLSLLIIGSSGRNSNSPKLMNYRQLEKRILDRILSPSIYDSQIRPKGAMTNVSETDGPTKVMVNLYVRSFEKIDDVKMEFSVQITFRQQWNDNRLAFNDIGGKIKYLTMTERNRVWMPDTFFRNEKDGSFHDIIQPNLYVRVFPDGDVLYSIRVLKIASDFKLNQSDQFPGFSNSGVPDESEAVPLGHPDLPPHHRQLRLDLQGPPVPLEGISH